MTGLDVTIITGLSGAGRSSAADVLEDLGYFVIDNLPPALIPKVVELARGREEPRRFVLVVDVRSGSFMEDLDSALDEVDPDTFAEETEWRERLEEEYLRYHREFRQRQRRIPHPGWRSEYVEEIRALGYDTLLGD